jgi:hypothetical protein
MQSVRQHVADVGRRPQFIKRFGFIDFRRSLTEGQSVQKRLSPEHIRIIYVQPARV